MNEASLTAVNSIELRHNKTVYFCFKRVFDILIGIIGTIFLVPIALIIKIAYIMNKDYSPIFYRQERIGKDGKLIYIYKFRTMVPNADEVLKKLLKQKKYKEEWQKNQKLDNDPRITKVGKFIRHASIDEVPQFINVLNGDMSLIGPRPLVKGELDSHNGNHKLYESVKPGITGWWACNGRSATNYDDRLKLEYYYALNCNTRLDIKCIYKTAIAVIKRDGAK